MFDLIGLLLCSGVFVLELAKFIWEIRNRKFKMVYRDEFDKFWLILAG